MELRENLNNTEKSCQKGKQSGPKIKNEGKRSGGKERTMGTIVHEIDASEFMRALLSHELRS